MAISDELKRKLGVGGGNITEILNNAGGHGANIAEAIRDVEGGGGGSGDDTLKSISSVYRVSSWEPFFKLGRSGHANEVLHAGDTLIGKIHNVSDEYGHVYDCPWKIVGFRNVTALIDGVETPIANAPIMEMVRAVGPVAFDWDEMSDNNYYNYIGNPRWEYSFLRQFLNNSGTCTSWFKKMYEHDAVNDIVDYGGIDPDTFMGFISYLDVDGIADFIHPVKIITKLDPKVEDGVSETFDKFFPLSPADMMRGNTLYPGMSTEDGAEFEYFSIDNEDFDHFNAANLKLDRDKYPCWYDPYVSSGVSPVDCFTRSVYIDSSNNTPSMHIWISDKTGGFNHNAPSMSNVYVAPACALV